jgi:hypothetical protein
LVLSSILDQAPAKSRRRLAQLLIRRGAIDEAERVLPLRPSE